MVRGFILALGATIAVSGAALADPIEGSWKTDSGATAQIAPCGGAFCITLRSGEHNGKQIGNMTAAGGASYSGTITDPADDKTYRGNATLEGNALKMRGCVLVFCRTQNWTRL